MTEPTQTLPSLDGVTHEYVDAGGLRTHVALAGPPDGPPILLVHGWPQHWWAWRDVIPALVEAGHRVIVPDLRGHGRTDAPASGYEKEQLAIDLLALLDALGVDRVRWVGHDWGAWVGQLAALRAPERIERLDAFGVPHAWGSRTDPRGLFVVLYAGPIATPILGTWIARRVAPRILTLGRKQGRYTPEEVEVFAAPLRARPHVTVAMYRTFLTREMLPLARGRFAHRRLEVPTRFVLGEGDAVTKAIKAGAVAGQPNLVVERIPGVGHFLPEEVPELVVQRILAS